VSDGQDPAESDATGRGGDDPSDPTANEATGGAAEQATDGPAGPSGAPTGGAPRGADEEPDELTPAGDDADGTGDGTGRVRRLARKPATWLAATAVLLVALVGLRVWSQVHPLLTAVKASDVTYSVPDAPHLVAINGETVYRIDPTQSKVSYAVGENIVGQAAGTATGSTQGIAGDLAVNRATPAATRVGQIVVNVEELHSDNNLRDARIRQDFLESHADPLAKLTVDKVAGMPATITDGQSYDLTLTGTLEAHNKTTPVTWQVKATIQDDEVHATGTTHVTMSSLGIGPISLAGLVTTSDDVTLSLDIVAVNPSKVLVPVQIPAPDAGAGSGTSPSFKDAVAPILAQNCASCHNTGTVGAAHWVLDNAGDAAKVADGIGTVVQAKYMPPWPASSVGVPLDHSKAMSQQDIDTIVAWSKAGGPLDEPDSTPIKPTPNPAVVQPRHDVTMTMPQGYAGSLDNPNDYRCFVLDPKLTAPTFVTGYEVTPGDPQEIHHAQIFHIDATQAAEGQALDGKDGKPGWSCYTGPNLPDAKRSTATETAGNASSASPGGGGATSAGAKRVRGAFTGQAGLIAGWVPGQDPAVYPDHAGVLFQPGDAIVLQVHYHYELPPVPDRSTVALQLDPGTADFKAIEIVNPLAPVEIPCMPGDTAALCDRNAALADDAREYGPSGALIEPGLLGLCKETPEQMTAGFNGVATSTCDSKVPRSGTIVADMGHMHTLGKSFGLTLDPDQPDQQVLLDIPVWNFDWQMNYQLQTPIHVNAGDTIRMSCSWDRSLDPNRPSKYIVFAEGTEDEMCFSTYALIPDP
jgi:polyisoprenoid-binding protein YceI